MFKKYRHKESGEVVEADYNLSGDWCPWYAIKYSDGKRDQILATYFEQQYEPIE